MAFFTSRISGWSPIVSDMLWRSWAYTGAMRLTVGLLSSDIKTEASFTGFNVFTASSTLARSAMPLSSTFRWAGSLQLQKPLHNIMSTIPPCGDISYQFKWTCQFKNNSLIFFKQVLCLCAAVEGKYAEIRQTLPRSLETVGSLSVRCAAGFNVCAKHLTWGNFPISAALIYFF